MCFFWFFFIRCRVIGFIFCVNIRRRGGGRNEEEEERLEGGK